MSFLSQKIEGGAKGEGDLVSRGRLIMKKERDPATFSFRGDSYQQRYFWGGRFTP